MTIASAHLDPAEHPPAAPPRELTRHVRRRAWRERHVRLWWLLGITMLAITCYYAISRLYLWSDETRLIKQGVQINCEVVGWGGNEAPKTKNFPLPADTIVDIEYTYKDQPYRERGEMAGRTAQIITRTPIPIFIDPNNPTHWTGRTVPGPLMRELLGAIILAPFVVVLFAMTLLSRRKVLRIYRQGEGVLAEVVSVEHSASAPFSRLIGCAAHVGSDDRVIKILLPTRKAPAVGETLWLLAFPNRPDQAIPAVLFE